MSDKATIKRQKPKIGAKSPRIDIYKKKFFNFSLIKFIIQQYLYFFILNEFSDQKKNKNKKAVHLCLIVKKRTKLLNYFYRYEISLESNIILDTMLKNWKRVLSQTLIKTLCSTPFTAN